MTTSRHRGTFEGAWLPLLIALPQLVLILLFVYLPALNALWWSVTIQRPFGGDAGFVGLRELALVLADPEVHRSAALSLIFTAASSVLSVGGGLILAVCVNHIARGQRLFRMIVITPYAIAGPVVGIILRYLLNPVLGIMAFPNAIWPNLWRPASDPVAAMASIVFAYTYTNVPINFIFLLAGLQAVPRRLVEAAALDGAGPTRRLLQIQMPFLTPYIFFCFFIDVAGSFTNSFGIVDTMTGGGPGGSTTILVYKIYQDGFLNLDLSRSSAESVLLMLLLVGLTAIQFRLLERRIHYR